MKMVVMVKLKKILQHYHHIAWREPEESRQHEPMPDASTVSHRSREVAVQAPEE
ncbi:unnamed protein product, partial [Timema podura]|nr:unnamed protein product [Timema podura]